MSDSKETEAKVKDQTQAIDINSILTRLEGLEERCAQFETILKDTVTFDALAARLTGKKTVKKRRAKRELSPEEKAAFHARMVAGCLAKEKARQEAAMADSIILATAREFKATLWTQDADFEGISGVEYIQKM